MIDQAIREARAHGDDRLAAVRARHVVQRRPLSREVPVDARTSYRAARAVGAEPTTSRTPCTPSTGESLAMMLNAQFGEIDETAAECARLARAVGRSVPRPSECRVALDARAPRRSVRRFGAARRRSERTCRVALGRGAVGCVRRADVLVAAGAGPPRRGPAGRRGRRATGAGTRNVAAGSRRGLRRTRHARRSARRGEAPRHAGPAACPTRRPLSSVAELSRRRRRRARRSHRGHDALRGARAVSQFPCRRRPPDRLLRRGRPLPRRARRDRWSRTRRRTTLRARDRDRHCERIADVARAQQPSLRAVSRPSRPARRTGAGAANCSKAS